MHTFTFVTSLLKKACIFCRAKLSNQPNNREVKHDVHGKRQTAKIELLVSDFSRLYNLGKLFVFTVIKGFFPIFRLALFKC